MIKRLKRAVCTIKSLVTFTMESIRTVSAMGEEGCTTLALKRSMTEIGPTIEGRVKAQSLIRRATSAVGSLGLTIWRAS